ncbi:hypothetical protein BH23CYA1_BH23CYA1_00860 [soil metagenome]
MPVQFLSDADHARLNRFPKDIETDDLDRFFCSNSKFQTTDTQNP